MDGNSLRFLKYRFLMKQFYMIDNVIQTPYYFDHIVSADDNYR